MKTKGLRYLFLASLVGVLLVVLLAFVSSNQRSVIPTSTGIPDTAPLREPDAVRSVNILLDDFNP